MLDTWSNYFVLTGSAGATLVGLLFVAVTLSTGLPTSRTLDIARASMTPALYSFGGVLLQSMLALVPWKSVWHVGIVFAVMGVVGGLYRIRAIRLRNTLHLKAISGPVDRIFHNVLPLLASVSLVVGGWSIIAGEVFGPYAIALSPMLLLVSGIYRTWGETLALIGIQDRS